MWRTVFCFRSRNVPEGIAHLFVENVGFAILPVSGRGFRASEALRPPSPEPPTDLRKAIQTPAKLPNMIDCIALIHGPRLHVVTIAQVEHADRNAAGNQVEVVRCHQYGYPNAVKLFGPDESLPTTRRPGYQSVCPPAVPRALFIHRAGNASTLLFTARKLNREVLRFCPVARL